MNIFNMFFLIKYLHKKMQNKALYFIDKLSFFPSPCQPLSYLHKHMNSLIKKKCLYLAYHHGNEQTTKVFDKKVIFGTIKPQHILIHTCK